jgi:hypothetical protein
VSPTIIRMVVDLPAPLGPTKPVTRLAATAKVMSSTARLFPYRLVSAVTVIIGVAPYL